MQASVLWQGTHFYQSQCAGQMGITGRLWSIRAFCFHQLSLPAQPLFIHLMLVPKETDILLYSAWQVGLLLTLCFLQEAE